jgi:hypothetical protein
MSIFYFPSRALHKSGIDTCKAFAARTIDNGVNKGLIREAVGTVAPSPLNPNREMVEAFDREETENATRLNHFATCEDPCKDARCPAFKNKMKVIFFSIR